MPNVLLRMPCSGRQTSRTRRAVCLATVLGTFATLPAYGFETELRADGMLMLGGRPFFPLGLVELGAAQYPDWNDRIRSSRANVVWDVEFAYADTFPKCSAVIDSAQSTGYALLVGSGDTWNWDNPQTPQFEVDRKLYEDEELSRLLECVGPLDASPILGFANRDEPSWTISRNMIGDIDQAHVFETYPQIRAALPQTIVAMNHAPTHLSRDFATWLAEIREYAAATDVVMHASYPYPAGPGTCSSFNVLGFPECSLDRLPIAADVFRLAINQPGQPLWMIVQAYKNIPFKEARWQAYASVIHGAKGIFWAGWNWVHPLGNGRDNWPVIEQVMREMSTWETYLAHSDLTGVRTSETNLEAAGKSNEIGKVVVFVVSRNGYAGTASIFLPGAGNRRVTVPHEGGRELFAVNGWITDEFDSYEGRVYAYTPAQLQEPTGAVTPFENPEPFRIHLHPNPTKGESEIIFFLSAQASVLLSVHDVTGRRIATLANLHLGPGRHALGWNGRDGWGLRVAPGSYFIRATTSRGERSTAKIVVRK